MSDQERGKCKAETIEVDCSDWKADVPAAAWSRGQFVTKILPGMLPPPSAENPTAENDPTRPKNG